MGEFNEIIFWCIMMIKERTNCKNKAKAISADLLDLNLKVQVNNPVLVTF